MMGMTLEEALNIIEKDYKCATCDCTDKLCSKCDFLVKDAIRTSAYEALLKHHGRLKNES